MDMLQTYPWLWTAIAAFFGLQFGSFLNLLIWRLPVMLHQQWEDEVAEFQGHEAKPRPVFNLFFPGSHCTSCKTPLRARDLVPVLSFIWLKGHCGHCHAKVSWRYPLVELAVAAWWAWCAANWGFSAAAVAWAGFGTVLLALALIDADTMLLPDNLTLPLLWAGLLLSAWGFISVNLHDSVWGAVAGYLSLWLVQAVFKLVTGKQGMGEGDFKLLAALGAWLGWLALPGVVLLASLLGVLGAGWMRWRGALASGQPLPFGPCLAVAGACIASAEPALMFSHRFVY
jgi:leader peptidase (prepilin peptidase)/N-methyltransferase